MIVLIIDSAQPGAVESLCSAIRGRSWTTPVMVITQGRVACVGGSLTQAQQRAICNILGVCSVEPYALEIIRSIGKAALVVYIQP